MSEKISVDRFTRGAQVAEGQLVPGNLARLKPFLASTEGELAYQITGSQATDAAGGRSRRLKCIISGYFFLLDPKTHLPEQYDVVIESRLVLVDNDEQLPPLDEESADEDYVTVGSELDVVGLIEEEILLDLPFWAITAEVDEAVSTAKPKKLSERQIETVPKKTLPFAKLATLKKSSEADSE
jgi:uncharacterized protein